MTTDAKILFPVLFIVQKRVNRVKDIRYMFKMVRSPFMGMGLMTHNHTGVVHRHPVNNPVFG